MVLQFESSNGIIENNRGTSITESRLEEKIHYYFGILDIKKFNSVGNSLHYDLTFVF